MVKFNQVDLKPNQLWIVTREDGQPLGTTNTPTQFVRMIEDEFPDTEVEITKSEYFKSSCNYEFYANILYDGEQEPNEHKFFAHYAYH